MFSQDTARSIAKMNNVLNIKGTNVNSEVILKATYNDRQYRNAEITGGLNVGKAAIVIHFTPEDKKEIPGGLNRILLMTNCEGIYRATGIEKHTPDYRNTKWYSMGNDLEIRVDAVADDVIRNLKRQHHSLS